MSDDLGKMLNTLLELAPDAIYIADFSGNFIEVNACACQLLGYSREELLSKAIADIIPPEDFPRLAAAREFLLQGDTLVETWTHLHKNGSPIPTEVSASLFCQR